MSMETHFTTVLREKRMHRPSRRFSAAAHVTSFAAYRLQHSQKRFLRLLGHALMIQGIYAHTDGYIGNVLLLNQGLPQARPARRGPHKEPF